MRLDMVQVLDVAHERGVVIPAQARKLHRNATRERDQFLGGGFGDAHAFDARDFRRALECLVDERRNGKGHAITAHRRVGDFHLNGRAQSGGVALRAFIGKLIEHVAPFVARVWHGIVDRKAFCGKGLGDQSNLAGRDQLKPCRGSVIS